MQRRRHTPEQIIRKLREAERLIGQGKTIPEAAKELGISEQTYHRWRNQYGGMKADDAKRLKELERENATLKRIVADKELEVVALKEIGEGKLVGPVRRRRAVAMLRDRLGVSERWACRVVGQYRSTQRHEPKTAEDDQALRAELRKFSVERPRWGYRRAHHRLRELGWEVNRKRVQRLWREEGLRVPQRKRKRRRLGESTVPAERLRAERPNHVWAFDFQFDQIADGRALKLLNIVDEFTRGAGDAGRAQHRRRHRRRGAGAAGCRARRPGALRCDMPGDDRARAQGLVRAVGDRDRVHRAGLAVAEPVRRVVSLPRA